MCLSLQLADAPVASPLEAGGRAGLEGGKASQVCFPHKGRKDAKAAAEAEQQEQQQQADGSSTDLEEGSAVGDGFASSFKLPPAASAEAMASLSHKRARPDFHSSVGTTLTAPSVVPCGAWLQGCTPSKAAAAAAPPGGSASEGAPDIGAGSCAADLPEDAAVHTSVLRTSTICQVLAFDLPRTLDLCRVCPKLHANLRRLYQQGIPIKAMNV